MSQELVLWIIFAGVFFLLVSDVIITKRWPKHVNKTHIVINHYDPFEWFLSCECVLYYIHFM